MALARGMQASYWLNSNSNAYGRSSQATLRQQREVYDIDGDISGQVLVLTPFQKRLEELPRPDTRSKSRERILGGATCTAF